MKTWAPKPRRPLIAFPGPGPFAAQITKITGPFSEREILSANGALLPVRVAPDTAGAVPHVRVHVAFDTLSELGRPLQLSKKYRVELDSRSPFATLFASLANVEPTALAQADPDVETFLGRCVIVFLNPNERTGAAEIDRIATRGLD